MQAVILAAGTATRLKPLTDNTPKTLLSVGEKTILFHIVSNLSVNNIRELVIVTGFESEKIRSYMKKEFPDIKVEFIHNADYSTTNNSYSLFLAEKAIKKDFILLDSDIVFHPEIITRLLQFKNRPVLGVKKVQCGPEEIKIKLDEKQKILEIGKEVKLDEAYGESFGIEVFDNESRKNLFEILKRRMLQDKKVNEFYEASFQEMIQKGFPFYAADTSDLPAMEIDFKEDLDKARELIKTIKV